MSHPSFSKHFTLFSQPHKIHVTKVTAIPYFYGYDDDKVTNEQFVKHVKKAFHFTNCFI